MKKLLFAIGLMGCSSGTETFPIGVPEAGHDSSKDQYSIPDTKESEAPIVDAAPKPCVHGTYLLTWFSGASPITQLVCSLVPYPPWQTVDIEGSVSTLNCNAPFSSRENSSTCIFQSSSACSLTYSYQETSPPWVGQWSGEVRFAWQFLVLRRENYTEVLTGELGTTSMDVWVTVNGTKVPCTFIGVYQQTD